MIVMHYSTPTVAQRKKDSIDAAERSGIAKGIPQGTSPLPCLSGEGWGSELAMPGSCYAHCTLNGDFFRPMHFPCRKWPTRQQEWHSADTDLSAPYKHWEKSHTTPRKGANSQSAEVSEKKIKQKRRKEPKKLNKIKSTAARYDNHATWRESSGVWKHTWSTFLGRPGREQSLPLSYW